MGFYIPGPASGKVEHIVNDNGGEVITVDEAAAEMIKVEDKKAVICVVDNGNFDAAAFAYDIQEFNSCIEASDYRPKTFLKMDMEKAKELTAYPR